MSIICISGFPWTSSSAIAQLVATRLGYECLSGQAVVDEAAGQSRIPVTKLRKAFEEAPSLFGMSSAARRKCIAHVQAALSARLVKDDVVYDGAFGHFLIQGVSHVLKARIVGNLEDRIARLAAEDGCSAQEARKRIQRADSQYLAVSRQVFGAGEDDAKFFDLVIDASETGEEAAADKIAETARLKRYQPMTYSLRFMKNLELSHRLTALLSDLDPEVDVKAEDGNVQIRTKSPGRGKQKRLEEIKQRAERLEEVEEVTVIPVEDTMDRFAKLR